VADSVTVRGMAVQSCSSCGHEELEPGFMADAGEGSRGYGRWVRGKLETGIFGGAKLSGREQYEVRAYRCPRCGHLDLFTPLD
jgi:hypothetical protein